MVIAGSSGSPSGVTTLPSRSRWKLPRASRPARPRTPHLEESHALNHHVERVVGLRKGALGEDDLVRRCTRPEAELQARGNHGLLAAEARLDDGLVEQVLKLRAAHLEPAVLALARLCAMLSTLISCAVMPLAALYNARSIRSPY